jgi:hypothetical protein
LSTFDERIGESFDKVTEHSFKSDGVLGRISEILLSTFDERIETSFDKVNEHSFKIGLDEDNVESDDWLLASFEGFSMALIIP